ncbi:hypothetical protein PoB_000120300, partial [Plakobranchus ocellatus]
MVQHRTWDQKLMGSKPGCIGVVSPRKAVDTNSLQAIRVQKWIPEYEGRGRAPDRVCGKSPSRISGLVPNPHNDVRPGWTHQLVFLGHSRILSDPSATLGQVIIT